MKVLYACVCMFVFFESCIFEHDSPNPQASGSIRDSRERGVFNFNLRINRKTFTTDHQEVRIDEIWMEDVWFHDEFRRSDQKQIVIKLQDPEALDTFISSWGLGLAEGTYGTSNGNISIDIGRDTAKSYTLYVYKYKEKYNINSRKVVDSLRVDKVFSE